MLPSYIIEELRRREHARREEAARPRPRLDLPMPLPRRDEVERKPDDRGIAIIEVWG